MLRGSIDIAWGSGQLKQRGVKGFLGIIAQFLITNQ